MLGGRPIQGGMPKWKYLGNILLTAIENATFLIYLTEYHSGFRAYTRRYLESVNLEANSDGFVFDTEIIAQGMAKGLRICEIPIETRYFDEASQIAFGPSVRYGLAILKTMLLYKLHAWGIYSGGIFRERPGPGRPRSAALGLGQRRRLRQAALGELPGELGDPRQQRVAGRFRQRGQDLRADPAGAQERRLRVVRCGPRARRLGRGSGRSRRARPSPSASR